MNEKLWKILLEKDPLGTATEYSFTREELEAIYEDAYAEAESATDQSYSSGYEEGYSDGKGFRCDHEECAA